MNALTGIPALARVPRRPKPDRGARGRAVPKRVLTTVEVQVFDPIAREMVTETSQAYTNALPMVLNAMPAPLREAALTYAKAVEDVEAGGAIDPATRGVSSGSGAAAKEGRQFHALGQVEFLRRLEQAIGSGTVTLGCRRGEAAPVTSSRLAILRAVALDGLSVEGVLKSLRLGLNGPRKQLVLAALIAACEAAAIDLGLIEEIKKNAEDEFSS